MECRVISIQAFKGGVGKTTIATNLASALSLDNENDVLLIDADSQGNTLTTFGISSLDVAYTFFDVLLGRSNISDALIEVKSNLRILPPGDDLMEIQKDLLKNNVDISAMELFTQLIDQLRPYFTHIIIDTSPSIGFVNTGIIAATDEIIIPFQPEPFSTKSLVMLNRKIEEVKGDPLTKNKDLRVRYVVSKFDSRRNVDNAFKEDFENYCKQEGLELFETVIRSRAIYSKSIMDHSKPAVLSLKGIRRNRNCIFKLSKEV